MSAHTEDTAGSSALSTLGNELAKAGAASLSGERDQLAVGLLQASLTQWENPKERTQLLGDLISALTSDDGAARMRDFMSAQSSQIFARLGRELDLDQTLDMDRAAELLGIPPVHINAAQAQVWGVVILRYILRLEPIASASQDELVDLLAPTIQRYLVG